MPAFSVLGTAAFTEDAAVKLAVYHPAGDPGKILIMPWDAVLAQGLMDAPDAVSLPVSERDYRAGNFYRHYKNKHYLALHRATHALTGEEFAIYAALYGKHGIWARPLAMFLEKTEHEGQLVWRFSDEKPLF